MPFISRYPRVYITDRQAKAQTILLGTFCKSSLLLNVQYVNALTFYLCDRKNIVNGEDCGARGFPLLAYCCMPLQPLVCIKQRNVLVAAEVYGFQISSEQNGQATGGECGEMRWKGES